MIVTRLETEKRQRKTHHYCHVFAFFPIRDPEKNNPEKRSIKFDLVPLRNQSEKAASRFARKRLHFTLVASPWSPVIQCIWRRSVGTPYSFD